MKSLSADSENSGRGGSISCSMSGCSGILEAELDSRICGICIPLPFDLGFCRIELEGVDGGELAAL